MPSPVTLLRRIVAPGRRCWEEFRRAIPAEWLAPAKRPTQQRPLRLLKLERRRVLSADFSLITGALTIDGFDAEPGETLTISSSEDRYHFALDNGQEWRPEDGPLDPGVEINGALLSIDAQLLNDLAGGVAIDAAGPTEVGVFFGHADFSGLAGPLSIIGADTVGQQIGATLTTGEAPFALASGPSTALAVGDLNIAGDLTLTAFGEITDLPGSQITVTGNATFISRGVQLPGDFDRNGTVEQADYDLWEANYGMAGGPLTPGDANLDGSIDAADYTIWRDTIGEFRTGGGITLADNAADLFTVGGKATFIAEDVGGRFNIDVGAAGQTEFGSIGATGNDVTIVERTSGSDPAPGTVLMDVDAASLSVTSLASITDSPATTIQVAGHAHFSSGTFPITLGDEPADVTMFGSLSFNGGDVFIQEDGGVLLTSGQAETLELLSDGNILATDDASISIAGQAKIDAGAADIQMRGPTSNQLFGSLHLTGGNVALFEHDGSVLDYIDADTFYLSAAGSIIDSAGAAINVAGLATFDANINGADITLGDDPADTTNFGRVDLAGHHVWLQEDSGTELRFVGAETFTLFSEGPITDSSSVAASIDVNGAALLDAGSNDIDLGGPALTRFGSLGLVGAAISIQEDDGTQLTGAAADSLSITSDGPITDAPGAEIKVTGHAHFDAGANDITLGDDPADVTMFGSLSFIGGDVFIQEDGGAFLTQGQADSLELRSDGSIIAADDSVLFVAGQAKFDSGAANISMQGLASDNNFGSLHLTGNDVAMRERGNTVLDFVDANVFTLSTIGNITDSPGASIDVDTVADLHAFVLTPTLDRRDITLGDDPADTTNFGRLRIRGRDVWVQEDSATELRTVLTDTFTLFSDGPITKSNHPTGTIDVEGAALLDAGSNDITLGPSGVSNDFGSLGLVGGAVTVQEDSGTELTGVVANSLSLTSDGPITDAPGTTILVTNHAHFDAGMNDITLGDDPADVTMFGSLSFIGGDVFIQEDGGVFLTQGQADSLELRSDASVIAADDSVINILGQAKIDAGAANISMLGLLSDNNFGSLHLTANDASLTENSDTVIDFINANTFLILSQGSITDSPGASIEVADLAVFDSVPRDDIALGDDPTDNTNFGRVGLFGRHVSVQEDSGTELRSAVAETFTLFSDGPITDSDSALVTVNVAGAALLDAGANDIDLGGPGFTLFGTLGLVGEAVSILEDDGTRLTGITADSLSLVSNGPITDASGATIEVANNASLDAGANLILLGDDPSDTTNFGSLDATGGAVAIQEDSGTEITGILANSLSLVSDGPITDAPGATILVANHAQFDAGDDDITLGDDPADTTNFGSLGAIGGAVSIQEDSGTEIAGIDAASLTLQSDGPITDQPMAVTSVLGDAVFVSADQVTLSDEGSNNQFGVGGNANITSGGLAGIDLGVDAAGLPAPSVTVVGTLTFNTGGSLRVALDSGVVIGGGSPSTSTSTARFAQITAEGSITDTAGSETVIAETAELQAADDVVLGEDARFAMAASDATQPAPFDPSRFLAVAAQNVSVVVDSAVNYRTLATDAAIPGSFFLSAKGTVTQILDSADDASRLRADRVALASEEGAVLFGRIELTGGVSDDDGTAANFAVRAGGEESFDALIAPRGDEFNVAMIPSQTITPASPVMLDPEGTASPRPDGSGLVDRNGARVLEPSPIADAYAIVAGLVGDAKIGAVADATGARADLVGVEASGEGNAYIETLGEAAEAGDIVFSRFGAPTDAVVQMAGGVFTAIAAGALVIDTDQPAEQLPAVARTTKLQSATGTVTSVAAHLTFDSEQSADAGSPVVVSNTGPRMVLDPPSDVANAATTGLVLASTDFEQRVTTAVGSRGEDGLIVEYEWANVLNPREPGRPDSPGNQVDREPLPPGTPGAIDNPQVTIAPEAIDDAMLSPELELTAPPQALASRVVTARYNYPEEFIPANPVRGALPTTVRVYNDPAINLFDQGGEQNLNTNSNTVTPRIITTPPPAFFLPIPADPPTVYPEPEAAVAPTETTQAQQQSSGENNRSAVVSSVEVILYGRVDDAEADGWAAGVPGEAWPMRWPSSDGDFIREIKDSVNDGPSSEGRYRIITVTPRGEQVLEEWIKGDAVEIEKPDANERPDEGLPAAETPVAAPAIEDGAGSDTASPDARAEALAAAVAVATRRRWIGAERGAAKRSYNRLARQRRRRS